MAAVASELKELKKRVSTLEANIAKFRQALRRQGKWRGNGTSRIKAKPEHIAADKVLAEAGLLGEPLPEDIVRAAQWLRLAAEERQRVQDEMRALKLDPPLSQIVIDNRR
ncbi:MAG: hypothetical protein HY023_09400 [Chloroflexi bacterium]|nr:hypothetical protein [Chloroflexota bacterium]MBI3760314.1 hypothetical protein [Chloroflexota bacterium]